MIAARASTPRLLCIIDSMLAKATQAMGRQPLTSLPGRLIAPLAAAATRKQMSTSRKLRRGVPGSAELRGEIDAAIPLQLEHFVSTGVQFGYLYESQLSASDESAKPAEDVIDYVPTTYPGAWMPHTWLCVDGTHVSSHDVLDPNMLSLFTFAGSEWASAVAELHDGQPGVVLVLVDAPLGVDRHDLTSLFEINETGAVLVRPDGHVAWRAADFSGDAQMSLCDFISGAWGSYYAATR
ncbi:MAG: hypothetical protein ACOH2Q_11550 [Rhodococcus sp. (in: high G+C Gram-positive bacteria)]